MAQNVCEPCFMVHPKMATMKKQPPVSLRFVDSQLRSPDLYGDEAIFSSNFH